MRSSASAQGRVAGHVSNVQQAECGLQIGPGDRDRLGDGTHRVVQAQAGVPDRVPDAVGDLGHCGPAAV